MAAIALFCHWDRKPIAASCSAAIEAALAARGDVSRWEAPGWLLAAGGGPASGLRATTDLVIAADVRLDEPETLARSLSLPPDTDDATLLLRAYQRWGTDCVTRLDGDFAFALWDAREQRIFAARDRFGVRPLYYHAGAGRFAAGTTAALLLAHPDVPRDRDEVRIAFHLEGIVEERERTFWQAIRRLPPAHALIADRDGVRRFRYWELAPAGVLRLADDGEYAEAFRERFVAAVRRRLRGGGRVGSLLSGGLDSSSIACVARTLLGDEPLPTLSLVFPSIPESDESGYIAAVHRQGGFTPRFVEGGALAPLGSLPPILAAHGEPPFSINHYFHWHLYAAAAETGVQVLLEGTDGDTTLSHGTEFLPELVREGRWQEALDEVRGLAANFGVPAGRLLRTLVIKPLLPPAVQRAWTWFRSRNWGGQLVHTLLRPEFARRIGLEERIAALDTGNGHRSPWHEHCHALQSGWFPAVLELHDRATAAFGIEARYPFLDRGLVEFCVALPREQRLRRGWSRIVMRRGLDGILPPEIQWRPDKAYLGSAVVQSMSTHDRERLRALTSDDLEPIAAYVDPALLRERTDRFLAQPNAADALLLWPAIGLLEWLRQGS